VNQSILTAGIDMPTRLKYFLALSRTPHGLLDMAAPAFAALLCLGHFPSAGITLLGLITAFAGYTAVYALNDVIDYRNDRAKAESIGFFEGAGDLDALLVRHPMAHGLLSFREGLLWALGWSGVAVLGAYILNPVCVLIFMVGAALEITYCLLWRVSYLRAVVNGVVKTCGAIAAAYAVVPRPSLGFIVALFWVFFFWEIGGQNIPNDWTDIEEDRSQNAKTIPVRFGPQVATVLIVCSLIAAVTANVLLFSLSPAHGSPLWILCALILGAALLLAPAWQLFMVQKRAAAMGLFNSASYYPLALLFIVILGLVI
jgi:4-hydroxybenzoate polyprenyltransferase